MLPALLGAREERMVAVRADAKGWGDSGGALPRKKVLEVASTRGESRRHLMELSGTRARARLQRREPRHVVNVMGADTCDRI